MAVIQPFKAVRYSESTDLQMVTAPPYDVISAEGQKRLEAAHPHNIVHLTLGSERPSDHAGDNKYTRAGAYLREWLRNRVLVQEAEDGYFFYAADFEINGRQITSAGVIAALELEPFGEAVLPHEETMSGPKADRMELMQSTSFNLEPLWFITSESTGLMPRIAAEAREDPPLADVTDLDGVRHRVWRVAEEIGDKFRAAISGPSLIVADGHHRYETAVAYRDQRRTQDGSGPWDSTLALIQDPTDFGPSLLPIHRVVTGHPRWLRDVLGGGSAEKFGGNFKEMVAEVARKGSGTVGLFSSEEAAMLKSEEQFDTQWLSSKVFGPQGVEPHYEHETEEITRAVEAGNTVFLLAPTPLGAVISHALSGRRMPPKSTLFWPKPRSGLIMRDLGLI